MGKNLKITKNSNTPFPTLVLLYSFHIYISIWVSISIYIYSNVLLLLYFEQILSVRPSKNIKKQKVYFIFIYSKNSLMVQQLEISTFTARTWV